MANVIVWGGARFTLLSATLLRLQYAPGNSWDTRPSISMPNSSTPYAVPRNVTYTGADVITIATASFSLRYNKSGEEGFTEFNTEVNLLTEPFSTWKPGADGSTGNLGGTRLDLGCYDDFENCYSNGLGWGPLSRDGWAFWDDTNSTKMDDFPDPSLGFNWFNTTAVQSTDLADWFLFCAGLDYRVGLSDFAGVSGGPPLPPYAAFGVWWSTWYAFSEYEFSAVVLDEYAARGLPLDVTVLDMDWHIEPNKPNCSSWGGFTWNRALLPGAEAWVAQLREGTGNPAGDALAVSLNGHPDDGIGPCEENYTVFANMIGENPAEHAKFACAMANATWVNALIDTMLVPKGINFWWTDYGGCDPPNPHAEMPLVSSSGCPTATQSNYSTQELLWSNYVYTATLNASHARPMVLSRYGGIGSQRFGIGFSGDTQSTWDTLAFEVAMTPTAANVLFGYWSHDLGGYNIYCPQNGTISPCQCEEVVQPCNLTLNTCARADAELYTRWLQFGVVSPIFRTHCSHCDRRIWSYPEPFYGAMAAALHFRRALQPLLYTAAHKALSSGVVAVHPLYYDWATHDEAYAYTDSQYLLGDSILAAPVTTPSAVGPASAVWIPPGSWQPWDGGNLITGPLTLPPAAVNLSQYRLWVRAGSVVPSQPSTVPRGSTVVWIVFGGGVDAGTGALYEDDGTTTSTANGQTSLQYSVTLDSLSASISPMLGSYVGAPIARRNVLQIRGLGITNPFSVSCNGVGIPALQPPASSIAEAYNVTGWWVVPATLAQPWIAGDAFVLVPPSFSVTTAVNCAVNWTSAA